MVKTTKKSTIPRPLNCFLLYRLEKQKEIVAKCTGANHRDISKIISNWWNNATEEEKKPFIEKARLAKQEHIRLHPGYKYTPRRPLKSKRAYVRKNKKEQ
ncbi:high mobility group box domain-containing protein, partial [Gilbertella persicaria]|uniref:high mobility group box domain-containing protein n=1 Tax=Gilbertella persicaria TaxID=101096 RepID=UPI002220D7B4